ncbi:DUF3892 domain-containing protein [Bradyrhizobium sp. YCK136]|uniref:DUF3892 domain-containing protein n=1 Tax=Bradyrhizobium TaxID=374 RepID=UPI001013D6DE|nr:DUF3892 domain-containing protein [Bradyrhizobium diazoefficiens]
MRGLRTSEGAVGSGRDRRNGTNTFFTLVSGKRADVGVVSGPNGKYDRTHADGYYNDNLLALPECL